MSITLYGQPSCGPCKPIRKKLDAEQVPYDYVDISNNPAAVARLRDAKMTGTPIIETETDTFSALDTDKLNAAIEHTRAQSAPRPSVQPATSLETGR